MFVSNFELSLKRLFKKEYLFAVIIAFGISLLAYYPILLGKVAAPLQILSSWGAWSKTVDNYVDNGLVSDVAVQILPYRSFTINSFKQGHIPLWNDTLFNGEPYLANVQSAVFNPLNFIGLFTDVLTVHNIVVISQLFLTLLFTYIFLRQLKLNIGGSATGAISFGFCSYMIVWAEWGSISGVLCWLPLILYFIHRWYEGGGKLNLVGFSTALAAQFYFGHFQFSLFICMSAAAFALYMFICNISKWRRFIELGLMGVVGLMLAAPQILPAVEAANIGYRADQQNLYQYQAFADPRQTAVQMLSPVALGTPVHQNYQGKHNYNEATSFIGFGAFILALIGIAKGRRHRWFFAFFAVIPFSFACGFILYYPVWYVIEPLRSLPALRFLSLYQFGLCILAGFGADYLIRITKSGLKKTHLVILLIAAIPATILTMIVSTQRINLPYNADHRALYPWLGLILIGSSVLLILYLKRPKLMAIFLVALCLAEGMVFLHSYLPFTSRESYTIGNPAYSYLIKEDPDISTYRILAPTPLDLNMFYNVAQTGGYDSLYPKANLTLQAALQGNDVNTLVPNPLFTTAPLTTNELRNLGVRYIVIADGLVLGNKITVPDGYSLIKRIGNQSIYKDASNSSTVYVAKSVKSLNLDRQLESIKNESLGYHEIEGALPDSKVGNGRIIYKEGYSGDYTYKTEFESDGYVNLGQSYNAGWYAEIDGAPTAIYRVNYNFMAIKVPKGDHTLRFVYSPNSFKYGIYLSGFGILILIVLMFVYKKYSMRKK